MAIETVGSGSYEADDVLFLLQPTEITPTPLEERERLIATGEKHYSDMIGFEDRPSRIRMALFREALSLNGERLSNDIITLAQAIIASANCNISIVSIARAGTPVGILLLRTIRLLCPGLAVRHYSVSVIRDRGLDLNALRWIATQNELRGVRFVDGWTGKGTIAMALRESLAGSEFRNAELDAGLWVPLDICGVSTYAASRQDYLIPSTILGGTISGLISRSVFPSPTGDQTGFHQCVVLDDLRRYDISRLFIEAVLELIKEKLPHRLKVLSNFKDAGNSSDSNPVESFLSSTLEAHGMTDRNRVKIGIGETVRVLLRRKPEFVYLSDSILEAEANLITRLADERGISIQRVSNQPFEAVALIHEPHV
ncbi:MAG: hypothetical protein KDN20_17950 [Verrucomicrobiae bacterium]|nr:hypothetical protein [Verrucomicrobiae bacterium]